MNGIDLFSGIGGITLALLPYVSTKLFCEKDEFCIRLLRRRFRTVPVHNDVSTLKQRLRRDETGSTFFHSTELGKIDIVFGGFPCQDISCSKQGARGLDGAKSGLFFAAMDVVRLVQPNFVFMENVPLVRIRGLDRVLAEFADAGYECSWTTLSAHDVGAPHLRERWFMLATRKATVTLPCIPALQGGGVLLYAIREDWKGEHPRIYSKRRTSPLQFHYSSTYGNAVVPKQCRAAFCYLIGKPRDGGTQTDEMPRCGHTVIDNDTTVEEKAYSIFENGRDDFAVCHDFELKFLMPTPTFVIRANLGACRQARRLFLERGMPYLEAAALCGQCPHLPKDTMPEYEDVARFDMHTDHRSNCDRNFTRHRHYEFDEWLMGFPSGFLVDANDGDVLFDAAPRIKRKIEKTRKELQKNK